MDQKSWIDVSDVVKNYAQVAAWFGAACFFVVKLFQGYLVTDLSVSVRIQRQASTAPGTDYLAVSVDLAQGKRGSFTLHDARVIVTQGGSKQEAKLEIERFSFRQVGNTLSLNLDKKSSKKRTLNVVADELATFSTFVNVRANEPCKVEAAIIGTGFSSLAVGQWRSSVISLPVAA
jgi:hypothetical protein